MNAFCLPNVISILEWFLEDHVTMKTRVKAAENCLWEPDALQSELLKYFSKLKASSYQLHLQFSSFFRVKPVSERHFRSLKSYNNNKPNKYKQDVFKFFVDRHPGKASDSGNVLVKAAVSKTFITGLSADVCSAFI